jgi:hypothetical protein
MRRLTSCGPCNTQIKSICPQKIGAILAWVRALWLALVQETARWPR